MNETGQLERIIIGEGPTAGKPISAVRIGEPSRELPFCAIPSIRWHDNGHTFVLETWFNGEWLEVPLVSTLPPPPNASHQAPAALDAAMLPGASSRFPACDCSPSNLKPSTPINE